MQEKHFFKSVTAKAMLILFLMSLGGSQGQRPPSGDALRILRPGQTFAFDGFFSWEAQHNGAKATKTISVEEMAVVTEDGAEYLIPPQEELILISSQ